MALLDSERPRDFSTIALCLALIFLSACSGAPVRVDPPNPPPAPASTSEGVSVVRYGRYTLVEVEPTSAQQDLLSQMIDLTLPPAFAATVGDALRYVLLRSGYMLCEDRDGIEDLERLPLPAPHLHLGPLRLRQVLQLLAGPGWRLEADEVMRQVCYARSAELTRTRAQQP